jgi:NAD(P)-dependent dehydrogenase (short-subunit alcohol dehydrogenase family)
MQFSDRVAVITGGGAGIGKTTALMMAERGAKIGIIDWDSESCSTTVSEIKERGGEAFAVAADVSNSDQMERAFLRVATAFERVDILFANAGINGVWAPIEEITLDEWNEVLGVNLSGTFLAVKYAVPYLKKQGGSIIINSSINGTRSFSESGATPYCCSKAAQVAFTKMAALELAKHNIRVNVVCPGAIITGIHGKTRHRNVELIRERPSYPGGDVPLTHGHAVDSVQVAEAVAFLASDAASFISGSELWIDGAQSLLKG